MPRSQRSSKIEEITEKEYRKAKKIVEKHKQQLRNGVREEQKQCKHEDFYRHWYDEDHLLSTCRKCFYEWEDNNRPFLLEDYSDLTSGKFEITEQDRENYKKYQERLNKIDSL